MFAALAMIAALQPPDFAAWGEEALSMIRRDYYLPKSKLYAERPDRKQPAFNWGVGVMLSALNAAARYDAKHKPHLREFADASRVYWNQGGYDVLPAPKPLDRYYDDNAWMVLALVETYEVLGDQKYLDWAKEALDFALKGESPDGGIFWRETDRASRNTCSSAPTAAGCLAIYRHTKDAALLAKAKSLFEWTRKHLEDPADGLFWDSLGNDGELDKTKWTYNTALMLRTAVDLGEKDAASKMITSSKARWIKDGKLDDPGRFAHLLAEAWIQAGVPASDLTGPLGKVRWARSAKGRYPGHWMNLKMDDNAELLDQASFARLCFVLASKSN